VPFDEHTSATDGGALRSSARFRPAQKLDGIIEAEDSASLDSATREGAGPAAHSMERTGERRLGTSPNSVTAAILDLVMKLDAALAEATGVTLEDFPKSAEEFEKTTGRFWQA
jgi:hypothetical protein